MKKSSLFRNADKKTKIWAIALALVCVACAAAWLVAPLLGGGTVAVVRVDGEEVMRVDLAVVREEYDFEVSTQYGHNTVHIAPGAISVRAADCPDGVCVQQGAITRGGVPIICMPHHLSVRIEGDETDG